MALYNYRSTGEITKWDSDGNIEAQYLVSEDVCTCPAGHRHTCRHRQMLPDLLPLADTHWFFDYESAQVVDFNGQLKSNFDALEAFDNTLPEPIEDTKQETILCPSPAKSWRRL